MAGTIVGGITDLLRKSNMESDLKSRQLALARNMCRGRADRYLETKIMDEVSHHLSRVPATNVLNFLNSMTGDLETEFAAQLGWVPRVDHGMVQVSAQ
jgi:hypothetical protein